MTLKTTDDRRGLTSGTQDHDEWLRVGHYDPDFVSGVHHDLDALRTLLPNWDGYGAETVANPRSTSAFFRPRPNES